MTRLRLLPLVLLLGAAPAGVEPAPDSIVAEAKSFLKTSCAAEKAACKTAGEVLSGYLAALKDAEACAAKACTVPVVHAIMERDRKIDAIEHGLPPKARSAGGKRPLLRLSLLVIGRSAAALALADPKAEGPVYWEPDVEAPKMVELICVKYADLCAGARGMLREADGMNAAAAACEKKACPFSEQETLAVGAERVWGDYKEMTEKVDVYVLPIFARIQEATARVAHVIAKTSASRLAELEKSEAALLDDIAGLEKGPGHADAAQFDALNARGAALVGMYREASIGSDRTTSLLIGEPAGGNLRERINAAAARLASARSRLAALKAARGLGRGAEADGVAAGGLRPTLAGSEGRKLGMTIVGGAAPAVEAPRPVLLDRRAIPRPAPADPTAPPIVAGEPGYLDLLRNVRSKDPLIKADALRRLKLTETVGDPGGRAGLVHPQKANDTCAIVAQQGILTAHGLVPPGDPAAVEAQLAAEARSRGFYRRGTPDAYTADLLVDRGLLVTKQTKVPLAALDAAVRRGGMVIANVDARHLWDLNAPNVLGHAIVITGAEIGRFDGRTLGYYINDSGVPSNGAGRFVPIEQFRKAWDAHTKSFAEVR